MSNAGISLSPQIMTSGNNVYVVWTDTTPGNYDILFKRSIAKMVKWFSQLHPINLSMNAGFSINPQIMTSGNNVYVVWTDTTTAGPEDILLLFKRKCRMVHSLYSAPN